MRQLGTYIVDGHEYKIGHWPVDQANENFAFLLNSFGEGLLAAISSEDMMAEELGGKLLQDIVKGLFSKLTPKEYASKMREFTSNLLCDGKAFEYNTHFTGRVLHLHKVVFNVLRHQYGDFLDVIPEGLSSTRGLTQEKQTSIG